MKRTEMKRSTKPMAKRSAKAEARYAGTDGKGEGRRAFVRRILRERPSCEVAITGRCTYDATEVHERLRRSAGGSITDDANVMALCHWCHQWVHANPRISYERGWLVRRGPEDPDDVEVESCD